MSRLIMGPFNRIEGDLEVRLDVSSGYVNKAFVTSPMYRGFERILTGKPVSDALVYAPRICGICSVSQSVAAAKAMAMTQGLTPSPNGLIATNLIHACENAADHLTHFYLFFMPDFAREIYQGESWYEEIADRFKSVSGRAPAEMLPARANFMQIMGHLAGKWPHTLTIQPGGVTKQIGKSEKTALEVILASFRRFLEGSLFGCALEEIAGISNIQELWAWHSNDRASKSDFGRFLHVSKALRLESLGHTNNGLMSFGAYEVGGEFLFNRGTYADGARQALAPETITEEATSSWYEDLETPKNPYDGSTLPQIDKEDAYSWCKSPRYDGRVMEVGAYPRQVISGHPLAVDLWANGGANVFSRVVCRMLELAILVPAMQKWVGELEDKMPFCVRGSSETITGNGLGLTEAARGSLGHWLCAEDGIIKNYQIVAPTSWNFSPRDHQGIPGPLEQALEGAPIRSGETEPVSVQHIVRSFDPCLVCTVH
ncbi:nickel-dependent hydrogenase large subunit [Kordiimonas lipolytica]|uniref:Nickel-dependent hydrogenase large subunit n=1 Tax=Kordiimonas lipolytica TaxID=1662421 RepID=A0ABV8UDT4_9PROT|nr:nickel-dependent hydrogenase large subunit [Kordiimonas lipolytica]